ncbi:MAG: glycosyltransferase family 87 protein [Acidobacteria bacterium]|nr:glycosyltransferase family 87 protein [Acidobacteriota bacterium]
MKSVKTIISISAAALHLLVVASIVRQPLDVQKQADVPMFLSSRLYHDSTRMVGPGVDFFCVYHAGVNAGTGTSVYRQREVRPTTPYYFEFRYLPIVADTLGRAVTWLPPLTAYRVWVIATDALCWLLIVVVFGRLRATGPGFLAWLTIVLSTPFALELHMGQFTFVATAMLALSLWLSERGQPSARWNVNRVASAALMVVSIVLKLFPAVTLVAWVRRRSSWNWLAAVVGGVALLTIPLFVSDPGTWYDFRDANAVEMPNPGNFGFMAALFFTLERLGIVWTRDLWSMVIAAGLLLWVGIAAWVVLLARRQACYAEVAVLLLAEYLASYQIWEHHMSGAIVAGGLLVVAMARHSLASMDTDPAEARFSRTCAWLTAGCLVLLALPTPYALFEANPKLWTFGQRAFVQWAKPLPTLGLFIAGLVWLAREGLGRPSWTDSSRQVGRP